MSKSIPEGVHDLVYFLCRTITAMSKARYEAMSKDTLEEKVEAIKMSFPILQGTRNQSNLRKIGEREYSQENIHEAVSYFLGDDEYHKIKPDKWKPIFTTFPHRETILIHFVTDFGMSRIIDAIYYPPKTVVASSESEIAEYCENSDKYFEPEGWYEYVESETGSDFSYWYMGKSDEVEVTHWMPLPDLPRTYRKDVSL